MKIIKLTFLFMIISIISNVVANNQKKSISADSLKNNSSSNDTILKGDQIHEFSNSKLKEIAERSESKFQMLHQENKTLSICCAWEKYSNLFGSLKTKELLTKYKFLEYKEEKYENVYQKEDQIIKKYSYDNSFFKTYFNPYSNSDVLVCASISDDRFILRNNIQIGMSKETFLELLFDKGDVRSLTKFDTINIGENEMGELEYDYVFDNNKLNKIIIDTDFDWIDKELK